MISLRKQLRALGLAALVISNVAGLEDGMFGEDMMSQLFAADSSGGAFDGDFLSLFGGPGLQGGGSPLAEFFGGPGGGNEDDSGPTLFGASFFDEENEYGGRGAVAVPAMKHNAAHAALSDEELVGLGEKKIADLSEEMKDGATRYIAHLRDDLQALARQLSSLTLSVVFDEALKAHPKAPLPLTVAEHFSALLGNAIYRDVFLLAQHKKLRVACIRLAHEIKALLSEKIAVDGMKNDAALTITPAEKARFSHYALKVAKLLSTTGVEVVTGIGKVIDAKETKAALTRARTTYLNSLGRVAGGMARSVGMWGDEGAFAGEMSPFFGGGGDFGGFGDFGGGGNFGGGFSDMLGGFDFSDGWSGGGSGLWDSLGSGFGGGFGGGASFGGGDAFGGGSFEGGYSLGGGDSEEGGVTSFQSSGSRRKRESKVQDSGSEDGLFFNYDDQETDTGEAEAVRSPLVTLAQWEKTIESEGIAGILADEEMESFCKKLIPLAQKQELLPYTNALVHVAKGPLPFELWAHDKNSEIDAFARRVRAGRALIIGTVLSEIRRVGGETYRAILGHIKQYEERAAERLTKLTDESEKGLGLSTVEQLGMLVSLSTTYLDEPALISYEAPQRESKEAEAERRAKHADDFKKRESIMKKIKALYHRQLSNELELQKVLQEALQKLAAAGETVSVDTPAATAESTQDGDAQLGGDGENNSLSADLLTPGDGTETETVSASQESGGEIGSGEATVADAPDELLSVENGAPVEEKTDDMFVATSVDESFHSLCMSAIEVHPLKEKLTLLLTGGETAVRPLQKVLRRAAARRILLAELHKTWKLDTVTVS